MAQDDTEGGDEEITIENLAGDEAGGGERTGGGHTGSSSKSTPDDAKDGSASWRADGCDNDHEESRNNDYDDDNNDDGPEPPDAAVIPDRLPSDAAGPGENSGSGDAVQESGSAVLPSPDMPPAQLYGLLQAETAKSAGYEQKLQIALADYQNLTKRTASEIEGGVAAGLAKMVSDVLSVRDDFERARDTFAKEKADTSGLDSILRNVDAMLERYGVSPIDALGEIFDPHMHEAVSSEVDPMLDENTITREMRRGYAMKNTIIRPSMVVVSKKE